MFLLCCLVCSLPSCDHMQCWERAELLALLCVVFSLWFCYFPYGVLGQVWYLIELIPDLCLFSTLLKI